MAGRRAARRACACRRSRPRSTSCRSISATSTATGSSGTARRATRASALLVSRSFARAAVRRASRLRLRAARIARPSTRRRPGPDRRLDLRAQRRQGLRRQAALPRGASTTGRPRPHATDGRCSSAAISTSPASERDVHPKERKPNQIGTRPDERAILERMLSRGPGRRRADAGPGQRQPVHVVGAVAQPAAAEHRLADRLRARLRGAGARGRGPAPCSARSARATTVRRRVGDVRLTPTAGATADPTSLEPSPTWRPVRAPAGRFRHILGGRWHSRHSFLFGSAWWR